MKAVIKTMYKPMFSGIVIIGILIVLNKITYEFKGETYQGILQLIGIGASVQNNSDLSLDRFDYNGEKVSSSPGIEYDRGGLEELAAQKQIPILEYFKVSYQGNHSIRADQLSSEVFKIEDVADSNGRSILSSYDRNTNQIVFDKSGIYTFFLYARNQKDVRASIRVPVS